MTPDDEPTEAELEEAEALAQALDRGHAPGGAPDDALGAAAFLRYTKDAGALDPARAESILADALARARPPVSAKVRRFRWFVGALGLAGAGALAALVVARAPIDDSRQTLPQPPRALLEAQIDTAGGRMASLDTLTSETREYRTAVYGALRDRYGR